jgi:hypothetical protein
MRLALMRALRRSYRANQFSAASAASFCDVFEIVVGNGRDDGDNGHSFPAARTRNDQAWEVRSRYSSWSAIHMEIPGSTFADSKPSFVEVKKLFGEALNLRIRNRITPQIGHSQIQIEPLGKKIVQRRQVKSKKLDDLIVAPGQDSNW